jgi:hypothetical protein
MGSLFSRPKPPPPPSPAVEATLTAREKQVEADSRLETKIAQSRRNAKKKGGMLAMMSGGMARPDHLETAKTTLGVAGRNPRNIA